MKKWIFLAAAMFCINAHTQVVKCKDTSGKVIYADRACPANFTGSSVNLSGGNITEDQVISAQERTVSAANGGGEACSLLQSRAEQALTQVENSSTKRNMGALAPALDNAGAYCPSPATCAVIKRSVDLVKSMERSRTVVATLDPLIGLYGKYCQNGGLKQAQGNGGPSQAPPRSAQNTDSFYTNDEFGNLVRSDKCFMTKDTFGVSRRSAGCSK